MAQVERGKYCLCNEADKLRNLNNYYADSLYGVRTEDTAAITIAIINTTKDTLYLFNSYLQQQFLSSKYLHRIDLKKKSYKISFLPIVPYVFTKYADVISTTDEAIIGNHQIVYDFIKLLPNGSKTIEFKYSDIFKNRNESNNVSRDYNVKMLNKDSGMPVEFYATGKLSVKYNFYFEFAVYRSVDLLCKQSAYYVQEYEFDKQSKSFEVLTIPVRMSKYDYQ